MREYILLGSETCIWPRLTTSNAVNHHFDRVTNTCPQVNLQIRDVGCHEFLRQRSTQGVVWPNLMMIWQIDLEHVTFDDPVCHTLFCSVVVRQFSWYPRCVETKSHDDLKDRSWARYIWRPRLPYIVLLFRCPWSNYYSLNWTSGRKEVKL